MSVTISLYKIIPDVTYLGSVFDHFTHADYDDKKGTIDWLDLPVWKKEEELGAPPITPEIYHDRISYDNWNSEFDDWSLDIERRAWSDEKWHKKFEMFRRKEDMNYKEWFALKEKFKPSIINNGFGIAVMNLPVEEIYYTQGWFFKESFFKRKNTCFCTTSKKRAIDFLCKYIKLNYNKTNRSGRYYEGIENIIAEIKEKWDENSTIIFECAF